MQQNVYYQYEFISNIMKFNYKTYILTKTGQYN